MFAMQRQGYVDVSDGDIVSEQDQNELMMWRDIYRKSAFAIGDIANRIVMRAAENGFRVTQERIYRAVGKFCDRTSRTVRYYADAASFYTVEVRAEFDELPFSHFAFAMSTKNWRDVLEYAMEHPQATVERLEREFLGKITNDEVYQMGSDQGSEVIQQVEDKMREVSQYPAASRMNTVSQSLPQGAVRANHLSALSSLVDLLSRVIGSMKLRQETYNRLSSALDEIRAVMPEIVEALKE